jgi:hypothetical protein
MGKDQYKRYNDFKKDILERSKSELSNKIDISFIYFETQKGRKIISLHFKIKSSNDSIQDLKSTPPWQIDNDVARDVIEMIPTPYRPLVHGIIYNHLEKEGVLYVKQCIEYTTQQDYRNLPKYFAAALRNGYSEIDTKVENPAILSKQGYQIHAEQQKRDQEFQKMVEEKEAEQKKLVDSLVPRQFEELTKLAIEGLHNFDK